MDSTSATHIVAVNRTADREEVEVISEIKKINRR
jgi:hypothetical protein